MIESFALIRLPAAAESLRGLVRALMDDYLADMAPSRRARSWMGADPAFSRRMAALGWVGLTLPREYGGGGADAFTRFVLVEELLARGAPVAAHWIADRQSGPQILKFGTEAQKRFYLPRICRAEAFFCIGMSEPQSGSDLASVRSRATPDGAGWRLNGQKVWTSGAHRSHYMIALVRTSGSPEDRNKGLSQFIVDLSSPGVSIRPIRDLTGDHHFNEVFFDNVALGPDALIGEEGAGWDQVVAELAFERSGPERIYASLVLFDAWLDYLRAEHASEDWALALAGRIVAELAVLRSMSVSLTARLARGESPVVAAALVKDLGTELEQRIPVEIADALAADPTRPAPPELLRTLAFTQQISPSFSLRGGTREILRGVIARGLGLR